MPLQAALIHCPAGGSASEESHARAAALLAEHYDLRVYTCEAGGDPASLARQALADGAELLVAQGGDGTTSAVASALVGTQASLGVIPAGTANSIAGHLGIPRDVEGACAVILAGHERVVDTSVANGRTMVLLAAMGLHAAAIVEADPARKRRLGPLAYLIEAVSQAMNTAPFEVEMLVDGVTHRVAACAVTIANMAPRTTILAQGPEKIVDDDGQLDVTLVHYEGFGEAVVTALHLATRALSESEADRENIGHFQAREIKVTPASPQILMIDGEAHDAAELHVISRPRSLRVRAPAEA